MVSTGLEFNTEFWESLKIEMQRVGLVRTKVNRLKGTQLYIGSKMAVKRNILGYVELLCKSLGIYQPDKNSH